MSMMKIRAALPLVLLSCVVVLVGCSAGRQAVPGPPASAPSAAEQPGQADQPGQLPTGNSAAPIPAPGTCKLGNRDGQAMPDLKCTPGAINPAVTQANINETICKSGWTKTVRPPVSLTNRIKQQVDKAYGLPTDTQGELDHDVSLELGGAPDDPRNLWVEPGKIPNPKDAVENKLNQAVCSGLVPLTVAQRAIATSWVTAFDDAGLRVAGGKVCLRADPSRCVGGRHGDNDNDPNGN
jgi:hypothetical protein